MALSEKTDNDSQFQLEEGALKGCADTPENFELFCRAVLEEGYVPEHARNWFYDKIYKFPHKDVVILAFRGSAKSTYATLWVAWNIGQHPELSNAIIRSSYKTAIESGLRVARIIKESMAWKWFFPNIIPDEPWNLDSGYNVVDIDYSPQEWSRKIASRSSPTLFIAPYTSDSILGNRVNGIMVFDDIHDQTNTESETEFEKLFSRVNNTILPLRKAGSRLLVIGTTWLPNDLLARFEEDPYFISARVPATTNGEADGDPTWPKGLPKEELNRFRSIMGEADFARQFLLDPSGMESRTFRYLLYPSQRLADLDKWYLLEGVDYASIEGGGRLKDKSHFAAAIVGHDILNNIWVLITGVVGQFTQLGGERQVKTLQKRFPTIDMVIVESDGKGAEFLPILMRNPELYIVPEKTKGRKKENRWFQVLGPALENGQLRISDADGDEFLDTTRSFLDRYPNVSDREAGNDCMDAIFWAYFPVKEGAVYGRQVDSKPASNPYKAFVQAGM